VPFNDFPTELNCSHFAIFRLEKILVMFAGLFKLFCGFLTLKYSKTFILLKFFEIINSFIGTLKIKESALSPFLCVFTFKTVLMPF